MAGLVALCFTAQAQAATVAVAVNVDGGDLPTPAVESIIWHTLWDLHGHDALFVSDEDALLAMQREDIATLYHVDLSWDAMVHRVDGLGAFGGLAPTVEVRESRRISDRLRERTHWKTYGTLALFELDRAEFDADYVSMPHIALQSTMRLALKPVDDAAWGEMRGTVAIPVVIAADEEYRAYYGAEWQQTVAHRVDRANALLTDAGIRLDIVGRTLWTSDVEGTNLSDLLDNLAESTRTAHPDAIVVGFTQQTPLSLDANAVVEDVGRAYNPGRFVVVADQAMVPGHDPAWDIADEGTTVAHELLHALGVPHVDEPHLLMSAQKVATVHRMSDATRRLAIAAAQARHAHWDPTAALTALGEAAEVGIADPDLQLDYVISNLHMGMGVPAPGTFDPRRLTALTNAAIGRHYLRRAEAGTGDTAALRQGAIEHSNAALAQRPAPRHAPLIEAVIAAAEFAVSAPEPTPPAVEESPAPLLPSDMGFSPAPPGGLVAP